MNKLTIPIALVAVIMVAGIFAFVPVGQAATVHDSLSNEAEALADAICDQTLDGQADGDNGADLDAGVCDFVE